MWELHTLVATVDFHYDEKNSIRESQNASPSKFFSLCFYNISQYSKKDPLKVVYPKNNINRLTKI